MGNRPSLLVSSVVAAVLFSIGYLIVAVIPGGGNVTEADFADFYGGDPSFFNVFLLVLAMLAGSWALAWFFSELHSRVGEHPLARMGYSAAIIGAAGLAIGAVITFAPAAVQMNSDSSYVGDAVAHAFAQAGLGAMLLVGMYSLALAVAVYSIVLRRTTLVPGWLSVAGLIIALLMLGSYIWVPGFLLPIWVLLVGVMEGRSSVRATINTETTVPGAPAPSH